jgi:hypothetical protein
MALLARLIVSAVVLLAIALPTSASAAGGCGKVKSPTGNSEIDQYAEGVPGPCGENQVGSGGSSGGGAGGDVVPAATAKQLRAQGPDGQAAAALAAGTAPGPTQGSGDISPSSDEGMGILLPLLLGGTLLAGILYLVRRRRAGIAS